jgi:hypothetical protein
MLSSEELLKKFWLERPLYVSVFGVFAGKTLLYWSSEGLKARKWQKRHAPHGAVKTVWRDDPK